MGKGFPIWFGIAAGIVGFALAEEIIQTPENKTPPPPRLKFQFREHYPNRFS